MKNEAKRIRRKIRKENKAKRFASRDIKHKAHQLNKVLEVLKTKEKGSKLLGKLKSIKNIVK